MQTVKKLKADSKFLRNKTLDKPIRKHENMIMKKEIKTEDVRRKK